VLFSKLVFLDEVSGVPWAVFVDASPSTPSANARRSAAAWGKGRRSWRSGLPPRRATT